MTTLPLQSYRSLERVPCGGPLTGVLSSVSVVREVCSPGEAYHHKAMPGLGIYLTEQGEAEINAGGRIVTHRAGSLVLIRAGLPLRETVGPYAAWRVGYLILSGPWADALGDMLEERGRGVAEYKATPLNWQHRFRELLELGFGQGDGWQWSFLSGCAELFGWVTRYPASAEGPDHLLDELERLLDTAPTRSWSVDEMACALNMTGRQFGYRFGKVVGCSPALWLRQRRVAAARRLLSEGQSVSATAEALGFANPYHFSRLYKKVTGMSPSALHRLPGNDRLESLSEERDNAVQAIGCAEMLRKD